MISSEHNRQSVSSVLTEWQDRQANSCRYNELKKKCGVCYKRKHSAESFMMNRNYLDGKGDYHSSLTDDTHEAAADELVH